MKSNNWPMLAWSTPGDVKANRMIFFAQGHLDEGKQRDEANPDSRGFPGESLVTLVHNHLC